tara:strand:+ start:1475 stop:1822 length:348 start_codon:yes stop_codon:yes gene_type:complete
MAKEKDKQISIPKQLSKEMLFKIWEANNIPEEEILKMKKIFEDIANTASKVKSDYENSPSEFHGAVDLDKGLVSGSGIQVHSETLSEDENEEIEWDLIPKVKTKDLKSIKTKKKK